MLLSKSVLRACSHKQGIQEYIDTITPDLISNLPNLKSFPTYKLPRNKKLNDFDVFYFTHALSVHKLRL